jgi:hypothetical protein
MSHNMMPQIVRLQFITLLVNSIQAGYLSSVFLAPAGLAYKLTLKMCKTCYYHPRVFGIAG